VASHVTAKIGGILVHDGFLVGKYHEDGGVPHSSSSPSTHRVAVKEKRKEVEVAKNREEPVPNEAPVG
jgi:hypothetical protein